MADKQTPKKTKKSSESGCKCGRGHNSDSICDYFALAELKHEHKEIEHKNIMEELAYKRESEKISHEHEQERQRIKSAEIRKMQERKEAARYARDYSKDLGYGGRR
jgi:hypothetical protein